MRIGELAARHNINTSAIRYYERKGLLSDVTRTNGVREFGRSEDLRIGFIQLAQRAGFTIAEVHELLHGFGKRKPSVRWRNTVSAKRQEITTSIEQSQRMLRVLDKLADCECPTLEDCGAEFVNAQKRCCGP